MIDIERFLPGLYQTQQIDSKILHLEIPRNEISNLQVIDFLLA